MFGCLMEIIKIEIDYFDNGKISLIIKNNENEEQTIFTLYSLKYKTYPLYHGCKKVAKFPMKGYHEIGEETGFGIKHRKKWDEKDEEKEPEKRKCDLYFLDKEIELVDFIDEYINERIIHVLEPNTTKQDYIYKFLNLIEYENTLRRNKELVEKEEQLRKEKNNSNDCKIF